MPLYCAKTARDAQMRAANKEPRWELPTGAISLVHLHEGLQVFLDGGSIFSPAGDGHRDGVILVLEIGVEEIGEAGEFLFDHPQGQASHQVVDKDVFHSSHCKFLLDLSSTLL